MITTRVGDLFLCLGNTDVHAFISARALRCRELAHHNEVRQAHIGNGDELRSWRRRFRFSYSQVIVRECIVYATM